MGTVSVSLPSDGTGADVGDYNTPITTIVGEINGNIDNANIKTGAAIAGSKLADDFGITPAKLAASVFSSIIFDFVASGCVWTADAAGSTRVASMTAGVVYIGGKRLTVAAVTSRTFTASKDVYVDFSDNGDGTALITYTDATTNAASSSLAAGSLRNAIIVVGASSIAATGSINQGEENKILPIASSIPYAVTDSLGNLICPRDPNRKVLGYRQILSNFSTASGSFVQVTGLSVPVIVPTGRKVKITIWGDSMFTSTTASGVLTTIYDGVVASGTQVAQSTFATAAANQQAPVSTIAYVTPAASSKTYNAGMKVTGGTGQIVATSTSPAFLMVELV